ncbi:MAG: leucyl/phenylalanyl-tRNA--protein transferase [Nostocaceae cyanobacterium]|nr:leucyl/phenylalanyl-tRNA--protein transferase [Nostocaceae cyanobacterium]
MKIENLPPVFQNTRKASTKVYQVFLDGIIMKFFPSPETAICSACNLMPASPERVISNYYQGMVLIGKNNTEHVVWKTFPERAIITADTAHIPKRLKSIIRKQPFEIRYNTNFEEVIRSCQRDKTWINEPLIQIYSKLFEKGCVETIETYEEGRLVGGIWGVVINQNFGIMSMFHQANHAGAIALATLVNHLQEGKYHLIDCGVINSNFARYGATVISCEEFVNRLAQAHF